MRNLLSKGAVLAAAAAALPASAQNGLTVYGGWRGGGSFESTNGDSATLQGSFAGSAALDLGYDAARTIQVFASYQSTELPAFAGNPALPLRVGYLHLGGTNYFDGQAGRGGYVVGGLGATVLAPETNGLSSEWRPSLNIGIGWQWPLADKVSLRFEARGYLTLIDSSGTLFCSGGCVVSIQGDLMTQAEAMVGLSIGF
ncbi:MAG: hypothetical protein J0L57_12245 [Burkholderiales bacterium]|nr:hypothetical protein [Burkholderiales bacterium]